MFNLFYEFIKKVINQFYNNILNKRIKEFEFEIRKLNERNEFNSKLYKELRVEEEKMSKEKEELKQMISHEK